jgi:uncharacterized protein (TIGR02145 family)
MTNLINILIFKNMKRMIFLMLTLLMLSAASMNAQVRIGGTTDPHGSAVLDLNTADATNNGTLGLALPRVALQSTEDQSTITNPVAGLAVYNTTKMGSGATAVAPGIYVFTGTAWTLQAPPVIITQPESFSWSRLKEEEGDPNSTVTEFSPTLTVAASGAGLTYQWYKKATNKNAADIPVATTQTYTPVVTDWGMNSYYCVVSNAYGSVKSDVADVAAGCGAKTVSGGWLKFMCYNLGADRTKDPFVFNENDASILGNFYQWGRPEAIARTEEVPANVIAATAYPYDWKIPEGYTATPPLSDSYHQDDDLWRNHRTGTNDPCPNGWHVPSQSAFGAIFKGTADADVYGNATANTWTPTGTWLSGTGNGGLAAKPDGSTTTLFFPAGGYRHSSNGSADITGRWSFLWSSTPASTAASAMRFGPSTFVLNYTLGRAMALEVRCVAED